MHRLGVVRVGNCILLATVDVKKEYGSDMSRGVGKCTVHAMAAAEGGRVSLRAKRKFPRWMVRRCELYWQRVACCTPHWRVKAERRALQASRESLRSRSLLAFFLFWGEGGAGVQAGARGSECHS